MSLRALALHVVALGLVLPALARAQAKVATCVHVQAAPADHDALVRLVASEVDRHPSHRAVTSGCATHLRVELIRLGEERFVTGRVGAEVPERVQVEGGDARALAHALGELLRRVLGTDPVALRAPGGESWVAARALALRDRGRSTLDFALLESASAFDGGVTFQPAVLLGVSREITAWQIGVEAALAQSATRDPDRANLDTRIRLQGTLTRFLSETADTAGFVGLSLGVEHERFSGPRAAVAGGGDGEFHATGPLLGLRTGVELLRTTTLRAFALADLALPLFPASDDEGGVVHTWTPALALGGGVRF